MWNLKKNDTHELICETETDSQSQRADLWLPVRRSSEREGLGVWDEQMQTIIGWINNKVLLYSTGNYIQYPVINCDGEECEKAYVYV